MSAPIKENFAGVVHHIFSNWTALQLAIDHGMGSPQMAQQFETYIVDLCCDQNNVSEEDIEDLILDILEEFHTECEDDSPKNISILLHRFISLLKTGQTVEFEAEFNKLPIRQNSNQSQPSAATSSVVESNAGMEVESSSEESEVEEGWTKVTQKRKSGR